MVTFVLWYGRSCKISIVWANASRMKSIWAKRENINRNEYLSCLNDHNALNDTLARSLCSRSLLPALFAFYETTWKRTSRGVCNRFPVIHRRSSRCDASNSKIVLCCSFLYLDSTGYPTAYHVALWWKRKLSGWNAAAIFDANYFVRWVRIPWDWSFLSCWECVICAFISFVEDNLGGSKLIMRSRESRFLFIRSKIYGYVF